MAGNYLTAMAGDLWEHLSTELWELVFSCLMTYWDDEQYIFAAAQDVHRQAGFYALRTVCKKFNFMFARTASLYRHVLLGANFDICHLPNLLQWIVKHGTLVSKLAAACGSPSLDVVLGSLFVQSSCLKLVGLEHVSTSSLHLLQTFPTITACHLQPCKGETLELQALAVLPSLACLTLIHGQFSNLNKLAHLTLLDLDGSHAVCSADCECAESLLHLGVTNSTITRFHQHGVSACSKLTSLSCQKGAIQAVQSMANMVCDAEEFCIPSNLSLLEALTDLTVMCPSKASMSCDWVAKLATLKCVSITSSAGMLTFPECLSSLSSLRYLTVTSFQNKKGTVRIECDFASLVSLRRVSFAGSVSISSSTNLSRLATVSHLKEVRFLRLRHCDEYTTKQLMVLSRTLGLERQQVLLSFERQDNLCWNSDTDE